EIEPRPDAPVPSWEDMTMNNDFKNNQLNLAVTLLKNETERHPDENVLISPFSISTALAMTSNGADGETRNQLENLFGQEIDTLNSDLKQYTDALPSGESAKCVSANSIWIRQTDEFTVKEDFIKTSDEIYHAGVFEEPFDSGTKDNINSWVSEHTDNMIDKIIDEISQDAAMYLINALTFDAKWRNQYDDYQIEDDTFTALDGTERTVSMMQSTEKTYYEDEQAVGFSKAYQNGYSFVALLPNEDTDILDYVSSLDSETLRNLLDNPHDFDVYAKLPAFETDYSTKLKDSLEPSIPDAFSKENADFSKMADFRNPENHLYINDVIHKTYISVDKNGTKAAAVTAVEMYATASAIPEEREIREVTLDRPFLYMIVDNRNNLPLFLGIVTDIA
ncbi:MAG: serpin family protein, partial [Oscillospiraceae bacterium]|nr:serpin family protein [Oscillospiraceae bacterium]